LGIADWVARICLVGAVVCLTTLMPMVGAAEAGAEGEGINETAFWAFVTIALTVVVSVIITSIFHYLSTRELREMGTEIGMQVGRAGERISSGASEDIKTSSE